MLTTNCGVGSLAPYRPDAERPWNAMRAQHLLRRLHFGGTPTEVDFLLTQDPLIIVENLLREAIEKDLPPPPYWAEYTFSDYTDFFDEIIPQLLGAARDWIKGMVEVGFREKIALFWHNHFVTQLETYLCPSYLHQYQTILRAQGLGNFKTLVKAIGRTPAMLVYLNGVDNNRFKPNENYARELYELFTLGRDNGYTQQDIQETARALTGYVGRTELCSAITFVPFFYDDGEKTIFGQTGRWDFDGVHDILFAQRQQQIATHICTKLYRAFVHPEPHPDIIAGMAETFLANDFEIAPVLLQLFQSEHFFDDAVIGTQIKSPLEWILTFIREGSFPYDNEELLNGIYFFTEQMGQQLFQPVDVGGWPGNQAWLSSQSLTLRWQVVEYYLYLLYENAPESLRTLAKQLASDPYDPGMISQEITNFIICRGLGDPAAYANATAAFKHEVPQNYFDERLWNLDWEIAPAQVALLLRHLTQLPEYQLI